VVSLLALNCLQPINICGPPHIIKLCLLQMSTALTPLEATTGTVTCSWRG